MEHGERRLRMVVKLQAVARGFLLRTRLRAVRWEYERVVSELQGGLAGFSWVGGPLARPRFHSGDAEPAVPRAPADAPERDASRGLSAHTEGGAEPEPREETQGTGTQGTPEEAAGATDPGAALGSEGLPLLQEPPSPAEVNRSEQPPSLEGSPSLEGPPSLENLRELRSGLAMELLWLQQAIASRKNYLSLRDHVARLR